MLKYGHHPFAIVLQSLSLLFFNFFLTKDGVMGGLRRMILAIALGLNFSTTTYKQHGAGEIGWLLSDLVFPFINEYDGIHCYRVLLRLKQETVL